MIEEEYKNWKDLNFDEHAEVLEAYQNTEDRNESDKVAPREEDVKDYYEDNTENFGFVRNSQEKRDTGLRELALYDTNGAKMLELVFDRDKNFAYNFDMPMKTFLKTITIKARIEDNGD